MVVGADPGAAGRSGEDGGTDRDAEAAAELDGRLDERGREALLVVGDATDARDVEAEEAGAVAQAVEDERGQQYGRIGGVLPARRKRKMPAPWRSRPITAGTRSPTLAITFGAMLTATRMDTAIGTIAMPAFRAL